MNEDLFIFLTRIIEKLESIDVQLKRINFRQSNCEKIDDYCEEIVYCEPDVYCEEIVYCEPDVYCEEIVYCEPDVYCDDVYNPCIDYSYVYNPYYDYTLDYLIPIDYYY